MDDATWAMIAVGLFIAGLLMGNRWLGPPYPYLMESEPCESVEIDE